MLELWLQNFFDKKEGKLNKYFNPKNYMNYGIAKILLFLSPIIKFWENKKIKKYASMPLKHQPIFIIGAPRTGSTILYQTITNQLDVLYIDNLICKFYRNLFFGFCLSDKLFKQKAHNSFDSDHGNTKGLHAPSECGGFWYRWFPSDRHFIDYNDITDAMMSEIRNEIIAIINYFDKPLVFNNNNMALRIRLLRQIFPGAKFIIADREPLFVSQSLLKARFRFFGGYEKWWSILPENFEEIQKFDFYKQVVYQHYFINKRMYEDLEKLYNEKNYMVIYYQEFSKNKNHTLKNIKKFLKYEITRNFFLDNEIRERKILKIGEDLENLLKQEINKLDWENYTSKLEVSSDQKS